MLSRLPLSDPGAPNLRSAVGFLLWIARSQLRPVVAGAVFGSIWMGAQGIIPAALGAAINAIVAHDRGALVRWSLVVLALGLIQAVFGVLRHRQAVTNFLFAAVRVQQLVSRQAVTLGSALPQHVDAGEVASIGTTDVVRIGRILDVTARGAGSVVSYIIVAVILLRSSLPLGAVLLVGAPLAALLVLPIMRPLERRQWAERQRRSEASSIAADTVVGLRVLRGLGGEEDFFDRFVVASQNVRRATVRTAVAQSALDALQVLLPGAILVTITFLGARLVVSHQISAGQLVAYYAYAAFLVLPIQTLIEMAAKWSAATVAADRILSVLRRRPDLIDPTTSAPEPPVGALADSATGLVAMAGSLTAVVTPDPDVASALAARLGRYTEAPSGERVTLAGTSLDALPLALVRRRIVVLDRDPHLLAGTLLEAIDAPSCRPMTTDSRPTVDEAVAAASASDIVEGMEHGLATTIAERGRSLSGGQRQRVALAAALRADPDVLVLDEPTSAVDAHTEAAIAVGIRALRHDRTTVVFTTSPLMLENADCVVFVDGHVRAAGTHAELLRVDAAYRRCVMRGSV